METKQIAKFWSFFGTYFLLLLIALKTGALDIVIEEMPLLFSGAAGMREIADSPTTFLMMLEAIAAVIALHIPLVLVAGIAVEAVWGKGTSTTESLFGNLRKGNYFFVFFALVVLEELYARWFFLGVLTRISFLSGPIAFYLLFLLGNASWSRMHLNNYRNKEEKQMARVIPQFIFGIFLTYIFVKYGLFASILMHFSMNATLFALARTQKFGEANVLYIAAHAVYAGVSYALMDRPLSDTLIWFSYTPSFALAGWGFWDYVLVSIFATSVLALIFELLLYDQSEAYVTKKSESGIGYGVISYFIAPAALTGILFGLYALMGYVIANVAYRILVLVIIVAFLEKTKSGSATARVFWMALMDMYITICILQALGIGPAIAFLVVMSAINRPIGYLKERQNMKGRWYE